MPTKVILIRHGQTILSEKKVYCGHTDIALNETGIIQAGKLCKKFKGANIQKVFSSDLERAYAFAQTALHGRCIEKAPEFREINFGCLENLTHEDAMEQYPVLYQQWLNDPFSVDIPRGEPVRDFKKRVIDKFKSLLVQCHNKQIAIVTHAGPINLILCHVLGIENIWQASNIEPASVTKIDFNANKAVIEIINDTTYLK